MESRERPPVLLEPIKYPKCQGSGPASPFVDGWFFPFWFNGDGGFKEHMQLNWTNNYLLSKLGLPDEDPKLSPHPGPNPRQNQDNKIDYDEIRNVVKKATATIEDQNREVLDRLVDIKRQINRGSGQDVSHIESVLRDCLADIENKIAHLEKYEREILSELPYKKGEDERLTDIKSLVELIISKQESCCTVTKSEVDEIKNNIIKKSDISNSCHIIRS